MQVGTIVRMKDDPWQILGIIVEKTKQDVHSFAFVWCYKVSWLDDLCDNTVCSERDLEVVCQ